MNRAFAVILSVLWLVSGLYTTDQIQRMGCLVVAAVWAAAFQIMNEIHNKKC